tara:strand:+ start:3323 stop:4189 length:867 start_codon:yes stop_codon:yes gene_type:complete
MERRLCEQEVRLTSDGEKNKITGTAVVFYREGEKGTEYDLAGYGLPGVKERIMPGALKRVLGRSQGGTLDRNQDVYAAVNHSPDLVFARTTAGTLKLSVDDEGLHYEATPAATTVGKDAIENARAGNFGGSSFAFSVAKGGDKWTKDGETEVREIHKIDALVDVSPVTAPAYKATSVNARSAEECRASYNQWQEEQKEMFDLDSLDKRHVVEVTEDDDTITIVLAKNAEQPEAAQDEDEAPAPVDGECPDGWRYDEEAGACVAETEEEDEEAAQRSFVARLASVESIL